MTLKEIFLEIEGYNWRFENEMSLQAHFTAAHMSYGRQKGQKVVKGKDLYNPNPPKPISLEERRKSFEESERLMGPEAIPVRKRA